MATDVDQILYELLERADTLGELRVTADEVAGWPEGSLDRLLGAGLIVPTDNARGLVCDGCEEGCWVLPEPRERPDGEEVLTYLCTEREDIGIVEFPVQRLRTWRLDPAGLASAIHRALALADEPKEIEPMHLWFLGKARIGGKPRRFFFGWGYSLDDGFRLAGITDEHMRVANPVLLVPHRLPSQNVWPDPSGPILPLSSLVTLADDELRLDTEALYEQFGRRGRRTQVRPFAMPPGADSWRSVKIRVISDDEAEVLVGGRSEVRDFIGWGMADTRAKPPRHASTWKLMLKLAPNDGELSWKDEGATPEARTHMKLLRTCLREIFGLEEDPIHDYKKEKCWRTKFILVDMRKQTP